MRLVLGGRTVLSMELEHLVVVRLAWALGIEGLINLKSGGYGDGAFRRIAPNDLGGGKREGTSLDWFGRSRLHNN